MKCIFIKRDGTRCKSYSMLDSKYCWVHSPDINRHEKMLAYSRGGRNKKNDAVDLPQLLLESSKDIPPLLVDTIQRLRNYTVDVRRGTAIGYLCGLLQRSYDTYDIQTRIERLEEMVKTGDFELHSEINEGNEK